MEWFDRWGTFVLFVLCAAFIVVTLTTSGCADRRPTCADNPRNMQCFSADELQKELNQ